MSLSCDCGSGDFYAIFICEHCGNEKREKGYDDDNFHTKVIPAMKCDKCGKVAPEDYQPRGTKYASDVII